MVAGAVTAPSQCTSCGRVIVTAIIAMAHSLKLTVVAEGVETKEQARMVREVGCSFAQGFFFSPPLDSAKTSTLLQGGVLDVV